MLEVIEDKDKKIAYQRQFNELIASEWRQKETRRIVWRPDHRDLQVVHNRNLWFVSAKPSHDQRVRRFWNSFGIYRPDGNLSITVEVNIPTTTNGREISGFFARDPTSGIVYLMHDGGVGGGRKGIGRDAFLAWSSITPMPAVGSDSRIRPGIHVAPLRKGKIGAAVSAFVQRVAAFKQAAVDGDVPTGVAARKIRQTYADYWREFSGRKRAQRAKEVEYISRHGDVVDELTRWRPADEKNGERLVKDGLIDLAIEAGGELRVLYEVKTSTSRQSLYTAIGQILVHGKRHLRLRKYVVVPRGERIAEDIANALDALGIEVLSYAVRGQAIEIYPPRNR